MHNIYNIHKNKDSVASMMQCSCFILQDFGKYPRMRSFIQEYVQALSSQNDGANVVRLFVKR